MSPESLVEITHGPEERGNDLVMVKKDKFRESVVGIIAKSGDIKGTTKGKIERAIRNVAEEFIYLLKKFPRWLNGKIGEYKEWYNIKRYHRGINTLPITLYTA